MKKNTDIPTNNLITKQNLKVAVKFIPYFKAEKIHNNQKSFEMLDLATITILFNLYVRTDRFMTGYLDAAIEKGYMLKVLRRVKEILNKT